MEGSGLRSKPSTLKVQITDGSGIPSRKFCTWKQQPAGKRALSRSPAQSCRSVAAGDDLEATEKLYERHYLVIKIVSSFFACLIKFLYL